MLGGLRRVRDDGLHHRITRRSNKSPINKYVQSPRLFVDVHIPGVRTRVLKYSPLVLSIPPTSSLWCLVQPTSHPLGQPQALVLNTRIHSLFRHSLCSAHQTIRNSLNSLSLNLPALDFKSSNNFLSSFSSVCAAKPSLSVGPADSETMSAESRSRMIW